jgi:uncharacterized phage protein (TIGR01671 family)
MTYSNGLRKRERRLEVKMTMRDIEFRGQAIEDTDHVNKGEWVHGKPILSDGYFFIVPDDYSFQETTENSMGIFYLISKKYFEVIPETVGEFTGMRDGKDKKIYEGDILHEKSEKKNYLVVYCNVDACFYLVESINWNPVQARSRPLGRRNTYYIKVIGNIHDNPELLEGEKA